MQFWTEINISYSHKGLTCHYKLCMSVQSHLVIFHGGGGGEKTNDAVAVFIWLDLMRKTRFDDNILDKDRLKGDRLYHNEIIQESLNCFHQIHVIKHSWRTPLQYKHFLTLIRPNTQFWAALIF